MLGLRNKHIQNYSFPVSLLLVRLRYRVDTLQGKPEKIERRGTLQHSIIIITTFLFDLGFEITAL